MTDPARFDLPAIDGTGRVRLADFRGTPVVVNFFASWCGPCKKELPDIAAAARKLAGRVGFVAVNSKEISAPAGIALARSNGLADAGITLARDVGPGGSGLHDAYDVRSAMPVNAFYDADGKLGLRRPGPADPRQAGRAAPDPVRGGALTRRRFPRPWDQRQDTGTRLRGQLPSADQATAGRRAGPNGTG